MLEIIEILGLVFAILFVLFIPGFAFSWVFFPKKGEIDWLERITISFGLSIGTITLMMFCLNLIFGVKINALNTFLSSLAIIVTAYLGYLERKEKFVSRRVFRK